MYEAEYSAAIWEDVLNHKLRDSSAEIKVSPLDMLRERCRDPNVLYDAKEYTLLTHTWTVKRWINLFWIVSTR